MRWLFIVLLMCNGIYFLWQNYFVLGKGVEVASVPAVQSGGDALILLSELEGRSDGAESVVQPLRELGQVAESGPMSAATAVEPLSVEAGEAADLCWLIGPFKEEISGRQVVGRLAAMDIILRLQAIEVPGKPDYWVYIEPQDTRKKAISLLRELQAKKIDSYLITQGELSNGISLGFFTQKDRADLVYETRLKDGYKPIIKVVPRVHKEIWAIFDREEYGKMSDTLWEKIKEGNKGLERRKNRCDKIASMGNFE